MRFRRKAKLFPGVYLNFSKSGISTTVGMRGASINFGKQGAYLNTGIPGTGLYDRKRIGGNKTRKQKLQDKEETPIEAPLTEGIGAIKSNQAESTTTEGLQELKIMLLNCYEERNKLKHEIAHAKSKLIFSQVSMAISYLLLFGFFIKWFKENRDDKQEYLDELKRQLESCYINIDMNVDVEIESQYLSLLHSYEALICCEKIWDITSSVSVDQKASRSVASNSITRKLVKFGFGNIDIIKSKFDALHFENANGGDLYIYPPFVVIVDSIKKFGLIDIRELEFHFHRQHFIETEKVPNDTEIVDHTWAKVNKNGTRDKRFKDNYQIPVCKYGEIELTSATGLNEAYLLSNYKKSEKFTQSMRQYQDEIKYNA